MSLAGAWAASAAPTAVAASSWGAARPVPGLTGLPHYGGSVQVVAVSCGAPGNCMAVGDYADGIGIGNAFTAAEVNGRWQRARELPVPAGYDATYVQVNALSCPSAGNCAAGGYFNDAAGDKQAFTASEVHGTWHDAIELLSTEFLTDENAEVLSVSCPSAGNCAVGGDYADGDGHRQAFVGTERNGAWEAAQEVPGTATLNAGGSAEVDAVSCASAGNCAAGGSYKGGLGGRQAFVVNEKAFTWGNARQVAGGLNTNRFAQINAISCPTAGSCGAGGYYSAKGHGGLTEAFVISEANGTWGGAREVAGGLNRGGSASVSSISCRAVGSCTAGGYYLSATSPAGKYQAFVVGETKGAWGGAIEPPGVGALNVAGEVDEVEISCVSAGNCAVAGDYLDKNHRTQAFVTGEAGGRWALAAPIPGATALNKGGRANPAAVSCASATSCAAGGFYSATPSFELGFVVSGGLPQTSRATLSLSAGKLTFGAEQRERITVTVLPERGGKPGGTVAVRTGNVTLCTFGLSSSGRGSCVLTARRLLVGRHSLSASYSGSVLYASSASAAKVVTVVR